MPAVLQAPITISEILLRRNLLKNKKASFSDLVRNEMIKYSCNKMPHIYQKLFNLIFNSGFFPSTWCKGIISPIFKSGDKMDPGNYRGICISSCLGKFFCIILNQRLTDFVLEKKILHPSQIGFMSNNSTFSHCVHSLINMYINITHFILVL